jgi:16S rRNA (cytosine967-C5)-methyltransferase
MSSLFYHHVLVDGIVKALSQIFYEQRHADKVIESMLKSHRKWGSRDRRLVAETIYGIVRWKRRYEYILENIKKTEPQSEEYLQGLWAVHCYIKGYEWPVWFEEADFYQKKLTQWNTQRSTKPLPRAIEQSIPDWLDQLGEKSLPTWDSIVKALNQQAPVDIRANTLRPQSKDLQKLLEQDEVFISAIPNQENAYTLKERKNVFSSKCFREGLFEVQDRASQLVAPFLKVEPGLRVADTCAGGGGKSLHMAALMKNKGKIIAMDIHDWKLQELKKRAARDGVDIIETRLIDSAKVVKRLESSFDRVLMDVPCSGLGVLKRNPDAKWKLTLEEIQNLVQTQREILVSYSKLVKPNGLMVYSTCSILPMENEEQVQWFLSQIAPSQFDLEEQLRINPDEGRGDGFFMARFRRLS